jgi:hypothetical protein
VGRGRREEEDEMRVWMRRVRRNEELEGRKSEGGRRVEGGGGPNLQDLR